MREISVFTRVSSFVRCFFHLLAGHHCLVANEKPIQTFNPETGLWDYSYKREKLRRQSAREALKDAWMFGHWI
jgi:hypothetical protein